MNVHHVHKLCLIAVLLAIGANFGLHKTIAAQAEQVGAEQGVQVLTRGPVHEAFAETVTFDPEPGIVVPKTPPAAIEELPPDQKPEGANVAWVPGYWGWDDEQSNFLWVSGIWRDLPPGRQWVPGYWGKSAQGIQWTSGYWADASVTEVQYLSEPPATVEAGPNIAAPSADTMWLPGCWVWQNGRYAWRPGFWAAAQPDWDWVPAHYVYAPRGYVFVDGYWDYSISRRGVLFAPVYFDAGVYARRGFSYSPSVVIDLGVFANHLFLRPQYQHYYFGDYYAANYQSAGFYPSYSYNSGRYGYDPIYAHHRWQNRQDRGWEQRVAADFQNRRAHENARPPRTWAAQAALGAGVAQARDRSAVVATPYSQFTRSPNNSRRFQPVDQLERQKLAQHGQQVQRVRDERQKLETTAAPSAAQPPKQVAPARAPLPRSPFVAKSATEFGKGKAPPRVYEAPKPDLNVQAKPRVNRPAPPTQQRTVTKVPLETGQPQSLQPPKVERAAPQPQRQPKVERAAPRAQPQPQPRIERAAPQPQPRVERAAPQRQPQPKADRPAPQRQPQPKVDRPAPQRQPQPKVDRPAPQQRGNPAGAKQDDSKGDERGKNKNR